MLSPEARETRAALYELQSRADGAIDDRGFSEAEIHAYIDKRRAILTFETADGLANLERVGEVSVAGSDIERRYRLTSAGSRAEEADRRRPGVSPRQIQILERLDAGLSTEDIAKEFGRQRETVQHWIVALLQLFDVGSRAELLAAWKQARSGERPWPRRPW